MKINPKDYRPNVGMMILNQNKEIFVGKRIDHPSEFWQMPQGGIDPKEKSEVAALREMEEEVGIKKNKVKLPEDYEGYSFHSYNTQPLSTSKLLASEILEFRDNCFTDYHQDKNFLEKAPKDIVNECKLKLDEANSQSKSIIQKLKMLD